MTIAEFYLLLMQRDLQGLVIFEKIREYMAGEGEMAQSVLSLAEKGLLRVSEDGSYCLSEGIKGMLDILEKAGGTFVINGYLLSCPTQCFYFHGGRCLILQMDDFREGFVRLEETAWRDAVLGLADYEFMPEETEGSGKCLASDMKKDFKAYSFKEDAESVLADRSVLLLADWFPKNAEGVDIRVAVMLTEEKMSAEEKMSVEERAYLVAGSGGKIFVEGYSAEAFLETFSGIFKEGGRYGFRGYICAGSGSDL